MIVEGECVRWGDWQLLRQGVWLQMACQSVRCTVDTLSFGTLFLESERAVTCLLADGEELMGKKAPLRFSTPQSVSSFFGSSQGRWNNWDFDWSSDRLSLQQLDGSVTIEVAPDSQQLQLSHRALGGKKWPGVIAPKPKPPSFQSPETITATKPSAPPLSATPEPRALRAVSARGTLTVYAPEGLRDDDAKMLEFLLANGKTSESVLREKFGRRAPGRVADLVLLFADAGKENLQFIEPEFYQLEPDLILTGGAR